MQKEKLRHKNAKEMLRAMPGIHTSTWWKQARGAHCQHAEQAAKEGCAGCAKRNFALCAGPGGVHQEAKEYFVVENGEGDIASVQYYIVVNVEIGHGHTKYMSSVNYAYL